MSAPVEITSGWTLSAYLLALLNVIGIGGAITAFIRTRPQMREIAAKSEANLLRERAEQMTKMQERLDKLEQQLDEKDRLHEAERTIDRHRINNLSQCLDALLLLIEQDPAKAREAAVKIREMRAEQLKRENAEKATLKAAVVQGGAP